MKKNLDTFYTNLNTYTQAQIVSRGEYFCAKLMAEYLGYDFVDAKDIIRFNLDKTIDCAGNSTQTYRQNVLNMITLFSPVSMVPVPMDQIQVFPRGGGDITGAILGTMSECRCV